MMQVTDIQSVLQWWATLFILGFGFLPLTFFFFKAFFDRGYIFAKVLGMAITSYVIFLVGVAHILPFTFWSSYLIFALLTLANYWLFAKRAEFFQALKTIWPRLLFAETIFLAALFIWSFIHAFGPDAHGLEKYMDFGFINSILRSEYFPPKDMWFTPFAINYYYFGHLVTAVLTQLSLLPASITFNLMLSTIFALCFSETFSIGANLFFFMKGVKAVSKVLRTIAGLLTAAIVTLGGNLHMLYAFFKPYDVDKPQPIWELAFQPWTFPNAYWYPNATRYIYHTIHEFPIYSWIVADLHGHVLDIPFVMLIVALLLSLFFRKDLHMQPESNNTKHLWLKQVCRVFATLTVHPGFLVFIGFLLAMMYMTNAWDGAIYFLLTIFVLAYLQWEHLIEKVPAKEQVWHWLKDLFLAALVLLSSFALFTLPYNAFFKPFVSGIGVLCAPEFLTKIGKFGPLLFEANHCQHSYWWELLMLYGFFYFFVLCFLFFVIRAKKLLQTDIFVLILIGLSTLLILIPEFIYVKDIYPDHYRANTMFKLVFQAFMLLGISSAYIIFRLLSPIEGKKVLRKLLYYPFLIVTVLLLLVIMQYPELAVKSYYGDLKAYKSLNGTDYLKTLYPTDYNAITWINENIKGQPVILEAQGDSYTDFARVSTNTGLPTVLGWTVHEWLWRGSYDIPAPRIQDITTIYETTDANVAKNLLEKYNVEYVFIGSMELQKHPNLQEEKFNQLGKPVFVEGTTKVYKLQ